MSAGDEGDLCSCEITTTTAWSRPSKPGLSSSSRRRRVCPVPACVCGCAPFLPAQPKVLIARRLRRCGPPQVSESHSEIGPRHTGANWSEADGPWIHRHANSKRASAIPSHLTSEIAVSRRSLQASPLKRDGLRCSTKSTVRTASKCVGTQSFSSTVSAQEASR